MNYTPQEQEKYSKFRSMGMTHEASLEIVNKVKAKNGEQVETKPSNPFLRRVANNSFNTTPAAAIAKRIKDIPDDVQAAGSAIKQSFDRGVERVSDPLFKYIQGEQGFGSSLLQVTGETLRTGANIVGDAFVGAASLFTTEEQENKIKEGLGKVVGQAMDSEVVQNAMDKYNEFKRNNPEKAANLEASLGFVEAALEVTGLGIAKRGANGVRRGAVEVIDQGLDAGKAAVRGAKGSIDNVVIAAAKNTDNVIDAGIDGAKKAKGYITGANKVSREIAEAGLENVDDAVARTAKARGFSDANSAFLASLSKNDKALAVKMQNLAEKAIVDKRALAGSRPIDLVSENLIKKYNPIETLNSKFGKEVGEAAKGLKGKAFDDSFIKSQLDELLDANDIVRAADGKLDFSNSVFGQTPGVKAELEKMFNLADDIGGDAYKAHIFKKTIDEVIPNANLGAGLKGQSKSVLTKIRKATDDALDETFDAYKVANENFKATRDLMEEATEIFGKKGITTSKASNKLRAIFSNQQSRSSVKDFLENVDNMAAKYGVKTPDNLTDQALIAEVLEEVYGTQAVTSLQGEVNKAIKGAAAVSKGLRNPVAGAGEVAANLVEKIAGQTDDAKKAFLNDLFSQGDELAKTASTKSTKGVLNSVGKLKTKLSVKGASLPNDYTLKVVAREALKAKTYKEFLKASQTTFKNAADVAKGLTPLSVGQLRDVWQELREDK